ncbi:S-adenosyl-L-methionine:benzoic acid/salicylic acid carboxyl methyltransferase 3 [Beta vulgaris subsp. vulgaris]|uniref:S-adenosyl-L-methionine:benzoic acid/salicylic acid carboxyl methyltransferase 3 n=1 Tax=Beta vulgaris subsp. vulgaris TaxID=3555 RepID=UPI002036B14F|nr:S-adenosyl-L-methionine:benzoic acid/salicylic acid carboxyl methyltransferase 3 [Beta vulgaris subsp. vulgaris]
MSKKMQQVFRMKEGTDETSYAKTSYIQKQVQSLTKPMREKAIKEFYCREQPTILCIADLGCSSVELSNLSPVFGLLETVENARRELEKGPQEYQIYLNDLPRNDFNTIFRSLGSFGEKLKQEMRDDFGHYFVYGAPGSFHGRLFPSNHLHFIHSSYSLHWLSQVPKGIEDNKGNIYIAKTSPPHVLKAYYEQFERDFWTFLRCRSEEVVAGGMMVLTLMGRKSTEPYSKKSCLIFDMFATALNDMVVEGFIEEDKLNTFSIPIYTPSEEELGFMVEKEGSFNLNQVLITEVNWKPSEQYKNPYDKSSDHANFTNCMRAVAEYLLISHFGEAILEEVFRRYKKMVKVSMAKEKNVFTNITVSLTRKG